MYTHPDLISTFKGSIRNTSSIMAFATGRSSGFAGEGNHVSPKLSRHLLSHDLDLTPCPEFQSNGRDGGVNPAVLMEPRNQSLESGDSELEGVPESFECRVAEEGEPRNRGSLFTTIGTGESQVVSMASPTLRATPSASSISPLSISLSSTSLFPNSNPSPSITDIAGTVPLASTISSNLSSQTLASASLPSSNPNLDHAFDGAESNPPKRKQPRVNSSVQKYFKKDTALDKDWRRVNDSERATSLLALANLNRISPYPPSAVPQPLRRYLP